MPLKDSHNKNKQLQIRLSQQEKLTVAKLAQTANLSISAWVLSKLLPNKNKEFNELIKKLKIKEQERYALAELNDFLSSLTVEEFSTALSSLIEADLSSYLANYIAAMVELAAMQKNVLAPDWTKKTLPLKEPVFVSNLESMRLHLLVNSPAPFRARNIFIDSSIGQRV